MSLIKSLSVEVGEVRMMDMKQSLLTAPPLFDCLIEDNYVGVTFYRCSNKLWP